jgi:hypothetical protein
MRIEKCDQGHGRIVRIGRALEKSTKLTRSLVQSYDRPSPGSPPVRARPERNIDDEDPSFLPSATDRHSQRISTWAA